MTTNTWLARLKERSGKDREVILDYLPGMDQAGPPPDVKWLKARLKEYDLRLARQQEADDHAGMSA